LIYFTNKADGLPTFWLAALEDCWNEDPKDRPTFIEIARDLPKCIDSFARKRKESMQKNIDKIGVYYQRGKRATISVTDRFLKKYRSSFT